MIRKSGNRLPLTTNACVCAKIMPKQQRSAFSSEVETGSREETASKQKSRARFLIQSKPKWLQKRRWRRLTPTLELSKSPARKRRFPEPDQADLGCPVPSNQKFPLVPSGKSPLRPRPVSSPQEGRFATVTDVGKECGGRAGVAGRAIPVRTAKSCGSGAPTLASRSWVILRTTGATKPGPREEHEGNRKTIARGMPVDPGVPMVTTLVYFSHLHARLWVRPGTRHSLRPLRSEDVTTQNSDAICAARMPDRGLTAV